MKKVAYKFVVQLLLIAVMLSFSGCNLLFGPSYREASENIEFDDFNQTQMKAYIEAFLEKKYGIDFEVEDVAEILEGPFYISTDDFYTIAESENGDETQIWIDINGNIIDDYFLKDMKDEITQLFEPFVLETFPECIIVVKSYFRSRPSRVWSDTEDVKQLLQNEDIYTGIEVFIEASDEDLKARADELAEKLMFCHGQMHTYVCEDLETLDVDNFSYTMALDNYGYNLWNKEQTTTTDTTTQTTTES